MSIFTILTVPTVIFSYALFGMQIEKSNMLTCELSAKVSYEEKEDGLTSVEVIAKNNSGSLKYYFFDANNKVLSYEFDQNIIQNLSEGVYYCLVVESNECHTKIEFKL